MNLSNAELEYLRTSLTSEPIVRADSRHAGQFRPLESEIDILPMANGSARVKASDGSDCIVGVKVNVVNRTTDLVDLTVDISGYKDNDPFPQSLTVVLKQVITSCPEITEGTLLINSKFAFNLTVDCVVFHCSSHPLVILSAAIFQALRSARLPEPIDDKEQMDVDFSNTRNADEAEIPQFNDDWSQSIPLCPSNWTPPVLLLVAFIENTVIVDPTVSEQSVADASMFFTWKNTKISGPIRTINLGSSPYCGAFNPQLLLNAYSLVEECAPLLEESLLI